jgi:hypothetical protein
MAEDQVAPQLLCLLLEVRKQMRVMNARLERIGAQVERIDARVCRMERAGPSRAPPAGNALGPFPVAVRARAMHLLDLPAELLVAIATRPWCRVGSPSAASCCSARRGPGSSSS